jgi:hypothetical protein
MAGALDQHLQRIAHVGIVVDDVNDARALMGRWHPAKI